ncbi:formate--tetrahydrofolate ligase [Eisenibacter elegans]|uniref:formate--tetrahydrofolate ligase n=1 Tax=Eisenibacter elegans TaxID=997 RepID=UPI00041978A6|nr:formate--tetrahydrofolate ligase [Eisenibacter elegans]
MKSDIQIARETPLQNIQTIGAQLGLGEDTLIPYGRYMAKVPLEALRPQAAQKAHLILVTAITPTKAGIGKTTTSVGLGLGLARLGKKAIVALREPSLGPCFGMKGGAAGGGYAQVLPMENINLHFTGDFHAITAANNMIAALLDNYQYQHRGTPEQLKQVLWKRVLDVNDRSLRNIVTGLGGGAHGIPTETGFDITPASEIMAILCLATDLDDLKARISRILLGYRADNTPVFVGDLGFAGAVTVLLKDALQPNLVQTTENTPAIVHGGPFANIAHGCNSVLATKMALSYADYVVTEAGFGADLGAEKFFNIKCRTAGIAPKATVIVVTSQALKLHGGVPEADIKQPHPEGLQRGLANLDKHIQNMKAFGQSVVVAFNQYHFDTEAEMQMVQQHVARQGVRFARNNSFTHGGAGAEALAQAVVDTIAQQSADPIRFSYADSDDIATKINKVATQVYGARSVSFAPKAQQMLKRISQLGLDHLPVCIAKTQYSFSADAAALGVATDFELPVASLVINSGAGFIVAVCGDIMRMPGLPKNPQALHIDIVDGEVEGLS